MECQFAKDCWDRAQLTTILDALVWEVEGFRELVFRMISHSRRSVAESFAMIVWQIWKERNEKVWNGEW